MDNKVNLDERTKRGSLSSKSSSLFSKEFSLTKAEKEVLQAITDEFLTLNQIQIRRNCSKSAVYKIIRRLKKKGVLTNGSQRGGSSEPHTRGPPIRLHSQQFRIRIINKTQKYQETLKRCNQFILDENTVRLYPDIVEIYSGKSFFGINEQEATNNSILYWKSLIVRLENETGTILQKNRVQNIKIVKQHYAEIDSKLAKESQKSGEDIKVNYHDGKLAVIMDNSFGLNERECIHPVHNKQHSEAISKQVKDFIEFDPPTNSELATNLNGLIQVATKDMIKREEYSKDIVEHKEAIKVLGKSIKKLTKVISGVLEENKNLKLLNKSQTTFKDFL